MWFRGTIMATNLSRRELLTMASAGAAAATLSGVTVASQTADKPSFKYCLNTSTIRGQNLTVPQQIDVTAKAGYDAIEPWIGDLRKYVDEGGSLADLRKR